MIPISPLTLEPRLHPGRNGLKAKEISFCFTPADDIGDVLNPGAIVRLTIDGIEVDGRISAVARCNDGDGESFDLTIMT
jgi:hypothetical protein